MSALFLKSSNNQSTCGLEIEGINIKMRTTVRMYFALLNSVYHPSRMTLSRSPIAFQETSELLRSQGKRHQYRNLWASASKNARKGIPS